MWNRSTPRGASDSACLGYISVHGFFDERKPMARPRSQQAGCPLRSEPLTRLGRPRYVALRIPGTGSARMLASKEVRTHPDESDFVPTLIPGVELASRTGWMRMWHTVMPSETDYSGNIWHGRYVALLEQARVYALAVSFDTNYGELVRQTQTELVVHEMFIKYVKPAAMGERLWVYAKPYRRGIRMAVHSSLENADDGSLRAQSIVTLVPLDMKMGRPLRRWPSQFSIIEGE
ncbi:putative esterase [Porphyridium purpureum]|uniref:Putative esterase n=1 Tax=Porphyridium purpureum TaxID=35688 RepID=A0A5J4YX14_PORPP|nr:putative esterase [Porphyridium purpureum]|eukprot:POR5966..scf209_3